MTCAEWNELFGKKPFLSLTEVERKYLGISQISSAWDSLVYYSKVNLWYTRTTVFFDGETIVKVISEMQGPASEYWEYDTSLETNGCKTLVPSTSRGKPKPLTASNINAVLPYGISFVIRINHSRFTDIGLTNPRAKRFFPIGEDETTRAIRCENDFHKFMDYYIGTCRDDYFEKLEAFKTAKKVTIKYKPGDIFRVEVDRTHYAYGIITAKVRDLIKMPEFPREHSYYSFMMVPIMVRFYNLITEDPNLKYKDLSSIPLDRVDIVADNDIIWGRHTIVDHKILDEEDLDFGLMCMMAQKTESQSQEIPCEEGTSSQNNKILIVEWGFTRGEIDYDLISDNLKTFLKERICPYRGVCLGISPSREVNKNNFLISENREYLNEIFSHLGLSQDATFDDFAVKFGGLTLRELAVRINRKYSRS